MKSLEEIRAILIQHKEELRKRFKIRDIGIFGSYVTGTQRGGSDIDILVEFYEPPGWEFIDLDEHLRNMLGVKVDLVTPHALKKQMKDRVLKEVLRI